MKWLRRLYSREKEQADEAVFQDKMGMHLEIRKAHTDWIVAHQKLDWAMDRDQIDYAIFALEAAEKRYVMLLRQAKQVGWEDGMLIASQAQKVYMHLRQEREGKNSGGKAAGY